MTPMIDVVFLLLVFFMLASRFGMDMHLPLSLPSGASGTAYSGPPRLVDVRPEGAALNGVALSPDALVAQLGDLMETPADTIILRGRDGAELQRMVEVMDMLGRAGFSALVLVE